MPPEYSRHHRWCWDLHWQSHAWGASPNRSRYSSCSRLPIPPNPRHLCMLLLAEILGIGAESPQRTIDPHPPDSDLILAASSSPGFRKTTRSIPEYPLWLLHTGILLTVWETWVLTPTLPTALLNAQHGWGRMDPWLVSSIECSDHHVFHISQA